MAITVMYKRRARDWFAWARPSIPETAWEIGEVAYARAFHRIDFAPTIIALDAGVEARRSGNPEPLLLCYLSAARRALFDNTRSVTSYLLEATTTYRDAWAVDACRRSDPSRHHRLGLVRPPVREVRSRPIIE